MIEKRKHKGGSQKEKSMKHHYWEKIAALMLCAALLASNAVISRADEDISLQAQTIAEEQEENPKEESENNNPAENDEIEKKEEQQEGKEAPESKETPESKEAPGNKETPEDKERPESKETPEDEESQQKEGLPTGEEKRVTEENREDEDAADETQEPLVWEETAGEVLVKVKAEADVLPGDAILHVQEITQEEELNQIEKAVEEKAIEEQFSVQKLLAVDISFTDAQGNDIQPQGTVAVSVDSADIKESDSPDDAISVFHVDDNTMQDMGAAVETDGKVVFETSHFSTYVIIQQGNTQVTVTVEHYGRKDASTDQYTEIYAKDELVLPVGGMIPDYAKAVNWQVERVEVTPENGTTAVYTEESRFSKITVTQNTAIKIYYVAKTSKVSGAVTFYDYTVRAGNKRSINESANYGDQTGKRLVAGDLTHNYRNYQGSDYQPIKNGRNANVYTGSTAVITGLLTGLDAEGNPIFAFADPGFFTDSDVTAMVNGETHYLRKVYKNYQLVFDQTGDTYVLNKVTNAAGNLLSSAGADFFPLDGDKVSYEEAKNSHNYYFGMRYDVTFKLGDYKGPLNYSFTGDDDLWVVLDGEQVVIDLGGIHDAATGTVNLWEKIDPDDTEREHTLTVLYMERGAGESNCQMNFTLPSARISGVTDAPMADLLLYKVNSQEENLEGAQFKLIKDGTGEIQTATSTADGSLRFTRLTEGSYRLSETKAPNGYIPTLDTWVVKVEPVEGEADSVKANLYLSDGETLYTKAEGGRYEILNLTEQEQIESVLEYDKTAKVKNWEERTYDITITAASKLTSQTTKESGGVADVMMVLDRSGSMAWRENSNSDASYVSVGTYKQVKNTLDTTKVYYYGRSSDKTLIYRNGKWIYHSTGNGGGTWNDMPDNSNQSIYTNESRMTALKEAGISFIDSTLQSSPESKLGVVSFSSSGTLVSALQTVSLNPETQVRGIAALRANGGTAPQTGLEIAEKQLETKRDGVSQYVILFTDGKPDPESGKAKTQKKAEELREKGIVIFTVGFGLDTNTSTWLSEKIASEGCALTASNAEDLKDIFKKIQETITQDVAISKAEVRDVIDPRFQLVGDDGKIITDDMLADGKEIVLKNGGIVYLENGNQAVKWKEQTIPNKKDGNWERKITVKARETYIGGNNVTTNIAPDSAIKTGYGGDAVLPQPTVNVKADLTVNNAEKTIFLGDSVPVDEALLKQLFDPESTAYTGVTPEDFSFAWYEDEACTREITVEEMGKRAPEDTVQFYLKVTYDPGNPTVESDGNTDGHEAGTKVGDHYEVVAVNADTAHYPGKLYGVYTVSVVAGKVTVVKRIQNPEQIRDNQGKPIFTFRLTRTYEEDGQTKTESFYKSLQADRNGKDTNVVFDRLPWGTYTVEELSVQQYKQKALTVSADSAQGFPCHIEGERMQIGLDGRENRLEERDGLVLAVNEKTPDHHETSNDIIINRFQVKDGKVIITPVKTEAK